MKLSTTLQYLQLAEEPFIEKATVHGLPVRIEHKKGTIRELKDDSGNVVYRKHMHHDYGFFHGTTGRDGDAVDCFVGPLGDKAKEVYIVHMIDMGPVPSAREDEDKCFVGFGSADAAKQAFLLHYPENFYGSMTSLPVDEFKKKLKEAALPYRRKKITAEKFSCPNCGSVDVRLMPTDFETGKCAQCGHTWHAKTWTKKEVFGDDK